MSLPIAAALFLAAPLSTTAERSGWTRTGRYEEVVSLCSRFERAFPGRVRCERFGVTPEGRPMLALLSHSGGPLEPGELRRRKVPVVMVQGGIHAGEMDGKDAGLWVLRELLEGRASKGVLSKVALLLVPVFNADGHERFGKNQRPNQNGPEETGWRVTAGNLNLNRDYAKAEAPEMAAMLRLFGRYDPILHVDLHVTDGARFRHEVAVMLEPSQVGAERLRPLGRALGEAVLRRLGDAGHFPVPFYPSFEKDDDPSSGFAYGVPPPRFAEGYRMLKNRFGMLVEAHSWKDYATRVKAMREVMLASLEAAAADGGKWLAAAEEADRADLRCGGVELPLGYENTTKSRELEFLGYAYRVEPSEVSGKRWIRYDESKPEVWRVPYYFELSPKLIAKAPRGGYLVPAAHAGWLGEKLRLHGFSFEVLGRELTLEVEAFRATEASFRPQPYEGRQALSVKGDWSKERRAVPKGSLYVPVAQRGAALLVHLLEPQAPDSFLQWGFFNAHFEAKEYMEDYVAEDVARKMLEDPKVKAAFEERLKEPAFANSPEERLRFFYRRHPSFDERMNLYPVYRVDERPR
ncbi:MAG: peptidase M14 [Myxococcales bacterium]|nr:peptidase M14 [Myxococcales bacterium]